MSASTSADSGLGDGERPTGAEQPAASEATALPDPSGRREPAAVGSAREGAGPGGADPAARPEGADEPERVPVEELDPETRARRDAALRQIRQFGDPVLRARALPVDRFDAGLRAEVQRMGELMTDALGVGLAATQVGVLHRLFVYRTDPEGEVQALVNPEIERSSDERERAEEGCLSIAGVQVEVERPAQVRVRAQDPDGAEVVLEVEGLEARVIQHELDHLDGVLILDRISREERREAMRALREARAGEDPAAGNGGSGTTNRTGAREQGASAPDDRAAPVGSVRA